MRILTHPFVLLLALLPMRSPMTFAQPAFPPGIEAFTVAVMTGETQRDGLMGLAGVARSEAENEPDAVERSINLARIAFLLGFAELGFGNNAAAGRSFEEAARLARSANAARPTSEGWRVLADSANQLLSLGSVPYRMLNAGEARRAGEQALLLDEANPFAHLAAASYLLSAPAIAGGNRRQGRVHLDRAEALGAEVDYVRFLASVWRAKADAADGRRDGATAALVRAHAIYPNNWWLAAVADDLDLALPGGVDRGGR